MRRLPRPRSLSASFWRRTSTRRVLLRGGIGIAPLLFLGTWRGRFGSQTPGVAAKAASARRAQASPACVVAPVLTEGPYFVDELLYRTDIRSDPTSGVVQAGVPLYLTLNFSSVSSDACAPLVGAAVDIWQCNALGVYSDVNDPGFNTKGQQFLRGTQHTDENGTVQFLTIYPGWYSGRAVHTHIKVRTDPASETGFVSNTQLFYDDSLSDQVFTLAPYASKGARDTRNADDGIYQQSGGATLLDVQLTPDGQSYMAAIDIGVDLSNPVQSNGPPPGGPPPGGPPPGGPPPGS